MGPFAMSDLSGLDVGWHDRASARRAGGWAHRRAAAAGRDEPPRAEDDGRLFQVRQSGRQGARADRRSRGRGALRGRGAHAPASHRATSATTRSASACSYALVNRGAYLLEEGVALRPGDIDIVYVYGYGFPPHHGGPMWYADEVGVENVYARILEFEAQFGEQWRPSALLAASRPRAASLPTLPSS